MVGSDLVLFFFDLCLVIVYFLTSSLFFFLEDSLFWVPGLPMCRLKKVCKSLLNHG